MSKQIIKIILLSFISLGFFSTVYADTPIHLKIATPTNIIYDKDITVTPCDSDNNPLTPDIITAYCAILQSEISNIWDWSWAPGAFVTSINNISGFTSKDRNNNDVYHYWSWTLNGTEGATGLNQYTLQPNDLISLNFIDPIDLTPIVSAGSPQIVSPEISATPTALEPTRVPVSTPIKIKPIFDTKKASDFIVSQQKEDGTWGNDLYTDWIAISLASLKKEDQKINPIIELIKYLSLNKISSTLLTDHERHTMALSALGLNPYNINGENYIKKITDSFDGKQFGDIDKDNDDIFALIVLQNAGFTKDEDIIKNDISYILSKQKENGSWDNSVDMTGAAMESLSIFSKQDPFLTSPLAEGGTIPNAISKAKEYLKQNQKDDGGFGNVSSTSWAIEGILSLGEKAEDWIKNEQSPIDYLATMQNEDGSVKEDNLDNKIWQTSYALSALSGKTWNELMQKFEKPKEILEEKIIKKYTPKIKNSKIQNNANTINSIINSPINTEKETAPIKKSWFKNFLNKLFGI